MRTDYKDGVSTIGIFIGEEEYRGKGLGGEIIDLLLDYGFNNFTLKNISEKLKDPGQLTMFRVFFPKNNIIVPKWHK